MSDKTAKESIERLRADASAGEKRILQQEAERTAAIDRVLSAGDKAKAIEAARKEGIAFRSLNDADIANILEGKGIKARGTDGSPDALRSTVYYDGSPN